MAHRDLKPGNVMKCAGDRLVLLDFGVAVAEVDTSYRETFCGTPRYVAPEAIRGTIAPGQAYQLDVYAFGAMAFEMIAGRPPFAGRSLPELLDRHVSDPVPDLSRIRGETPGELVALVHACLAKDPRERPVSMAAIAWELQGCRRHAEVVPTGRQATRMPALTRQPP
jgi:serine/threonine-protein kinase